MPCTKKSTVCTKKVAGRKITFGPQKNVASILRRIPLTKRVRYGVNSTVECTGNESRSTVNGKVCVSLDTNEN